MCLQYKRWKVGLRVTQIKPSQYNYSGMRMEPAGQQQALVTSNSMLLHRAETPAQKTETQAVFTGDTSVMITHERGCDSLGQFLPFPLLLASPGVKSLTHYLPFSKVWSNWKNSHLSLVKMILLYCFRHSAHFQTVQSNIFTSLT